MQLAVSLWGLKLDSELLFVGDGGTTEPSRPTERYGLEMGVYYTPHPSIIVDADLALSRPRYSDDDPAGDRIPGAIESAASLGATYTASNGFFGGARLRYLGPAALTEDDSVRSDSATLLNLEGGFRFSDRWRASITLLNALDTKANDITYFYESRLPGEAAPVADLHFHPVEPRTWRAGVRYTFE
jgi:outer membrane receptor protein involved in Fe transport